MKIEENTIYEPEGNDATDEKTPDRFPIINDEKIYYFSDPEWQEGKIIHFKKGSFGAGNEKRHRFILLKKIGGLHYEFLLGETYGGAYQFTFKTEEYEYATTNLDKDSRELLFETINAFLKSVSGYSGTNVEEIMISPADASYSAEEIEKCTEEILASPKNKLTREKLKFQYYGFHIFDLYEKLFNKPFHKIPFRLKSKAESRTRFLKRMSKKHLTDWEIDNGDDFSGTGFLLKKHAKETEKK